ncbi:hypothetical protein ACFLW4_04870 [Chloroflexota bacterium]
MRKIWNKLIRNEKGQALVVVLGFMVLGGLTIAPLLAHMRTGLSAGRGYMEQIELDYAADAGIEDALWKTNNEEVPIDPDDYVTEFNYALSEDINDKAVTINIKQLWPLAGLESDEHGTTLPDCLLITGGIIDIGEGEYKVQLSYDGSEGNLPIDRVAVWLPCGFEYVAGSSSGITTDDPTSIDWRGGKALTWDFDPAVNFTDLPVPAPPGGGFTPGTEYPATRKLYFNVSPVGEVAGGSYSWVRTTDTDLYLAWDPGCQIFQIGSTATDNITGRSVTIGGYTYCSQGSAQGTGYQIQGDYRAIGNTMMEDTDVDRKRETFVDESNSSISDIPADGEVALAYLYWSGWREWKGAMEADRYVGLKIDGNSVYFNEQGEAVQGELPTDPTTEILRPNSSGSYTQLSRSGSSSNYRCVDEAVADEDSTYVYAEGGAIELDTYRIDNRSEGTGSINSVTVYARAMAYYDSGECADMRMKIALRTNSATYYGDMITMIGNAGWDNYSANWTTNPYTGEPWTWPEIDALQIGIKLYDDGTGYPQCTQVYAEVNYTPVFQGIEASKWWLLENDSPNYSYSCFKDVTELVKLISTDGNATYTITGVAGTTGNEHSYSGWSMIIFYASPSELAHQFFLYDHFLYATSDSSHTFDIEGFEAPADAEAILTCFVGEGDEHYEDDYLQFNGYYLSDATNPEDNVWNGKSSGLGGQFIDGVDIDTFNVSAPIINPGDTSAEVSLSTDVDCWNLIYVILSFRSEYGGLTPNSTGIISYKYGGT